MDSGTTGDANAVVASVGPEGATLFATSPTGDRLTLDIPEGALGHTVDITITPLPADGSEVLFQVEPTGLAFVTPARMSLTVDDADAAFAWIDAEGRTTLGGTVEAGELVLELPTLGFRTAPSAGPVPGAPPLGAAEGRIAAGPVDCDAMLASIPAAFQQVKARGNPDDVGRFLSEVTTLQQRCEAERVLAQMAQYCTDYQAAVADARTSSVAADDDLATTIAPLVATHAAVLSSGGSCDISTFEPTMRAKAAEHVAALRERYAATAFADNLDTHLDHFDEVIRYEGNCQLAGIPEESCGPLVDGLYPDVLDSLRTAAYADCRATGNPQPLAALYTDDRDPGQLAVATKPFFRFGRYTNAELEEDVLQCASALELTASDDAASTIPVNLPDQARTLGGGATAGNHLREVSIAVPADGGITFGGVVHAPPCAVADPAQDALVVRVNGTEVARSARASGPLRYLTSTQPIVLRMTSLLEAAGLPAAGAPFDLEIHREGNGCPSFATPNLMYTVHVDVGEPVVEATALDVSFVVSEEVTAVYCEEDNQDLTTIGDSLEESAPLPMSLSAPGVTVDATLVGLDTLQIVANWAVPGSMSDTCADGSVYTAYDFAYVDVYVQIVPLRNVVFTPQIYDDATELTGCDVAGNCGRQQAGAVLLAGASYQAHVTGYGYGDSGSSTLIASFVPTAP